MACRTGQHMSIQVHFEPTFLMSGILGANRCEICEMTSWMRAWFFIVFLAFMILWFTRSVQKCEEYRNWHIPDDRGLNNVFTIFVNGFQDICRLSLDLSLDRQVKVDTDLLGLEV